MKTRIALAAAITTLALSLTASAAPFVCTVGDRVVDRQGREGTVAKAKGADCTVKRDDGSEGFYLAWMLSAAKAGKPQTPPAQAPTKGTYRCSAAGGVAGTLRLVIRSATSYADRNGKRGTYTYDPSTSRIVFKSGPWAGQFGKKLGDAKIGVSSREGGFFGTTCDLEK